MPRLRNRGDGGVGVLLGVPRLELLRPPGGGIVSATIRQALVAAAISFGTFAGLLWLASEVIR